MMRMRPREQAIWTSVVYLWGGCIISYILYPTWVFGDLVPIFNGWELYMFLFYAAVIMTGIAFVTHGHTSTYGYTGDEHSYSLFGSFRGSRRRSNQRDDTLRQARDRLQRSIDAAATAHLMEEHNAHQAKAAKQAEAAQKKNYEEEDLRPRYEQLGKKDEEEEHAEKSKAK
jgi:hypothetical protein